jgi:catechol 2,3-dioxygenase-like lactoylglutathione lyase family enzyme
MLGSINIVAFVPTRDREKARAFYEGVLGMRFVKDDGFATVMDANGIMVRVGTVPADFKPAQFTILGWQVATSRKWSLHSKAREFSSRGSVFSSRTSLAYGPRQTATRLPGSKIGMAMCFPSHNMFEAAKLVFCRLRDYSTFHPLTCTLGFSSPNSLARYVAVTSRFSPGKSEM